MRPDRKVSPVFAALLGAVAACGPSVVWRGESLTYVADEPGAVCGGTPRYLERYTALLRRILGVSALRVRYHWKRDAKRRCPPGSGACAPGNRAYSDRPTHVHEVAHAAVYALGRPSDFLVEGLAQALGGALHPYPYRVRAGRPGAPRHRGRTPNHVDYQEAGLFVSVLMARFGVAPVLRLYRREPALRIQAPGDAQTWARMTSRALVRSVFRRSPDDLVAGLGDVPGCAAGSYRVWPVECEAATPWQNGVWQMERSLDCRDELTINDDTDTVFWSYGTFDVPTGGIYAVGVSGSSSLAFIHPCGRVCPTEAHIVYKASPRLPLSAGRYFVHLVGRPAPPGLAYRMTIQPAAPDHDLLSEARSSNEPPSGVRPPSAR